MKTFEIRQAPGPAARRSAGKFGHARQRRVDVRAATGQMEALGDFKHEKYLATGNRQYAGSRFEWQTDRNFTWRPNDGADPGTRGRRWRLVVVLKNGANVHEVAYEAWPV